jgi:CRISPR-associated protein Csm2
MATQNFSRGARPDGRGYRDEPQTASIDLAGICFGDKPDARLFAEVAEEAAKAIAGGGGDVNKGTQLRRFYDEFVMWQERVGSSAEKFADCQPYICMLKAKVAYAKGRKHVDANFEALLRRIVEQSTDPATLRQGKLFFEAFMAFYKTQPNK